MMRLPSFLVQGSICLDRKKSAADRPIEPLPPSLRMSYDLRQRNGALARPRVAPGAHVLRGSVIAGGDGLEDPPIHAATSGTVIGIPSKNPDPECRKALRLEIESDGLDQQAPPLTPLSIPDLDQTRLIQRLHEAGLVGLGGGAFPAAIKADSETPLHTLIVNGVECEPYVSADDRLIRERSQDILEGAEILARVLGIHQILIVLEENMVEAAAAMALALTLIPRRGFELIKVPDRYPGGSERSLIERLTGREVPSGARPQTLGILCQNVGTLFAVCRAVTRGEVLTSRVLTVGGEEIQTPRNLEVRIGTPIRDILAQCGGLRSEDALIWAGGPMMGLPVSDTEDPVTPATHALLAFNPNILTPPSPQPCIRCGACHEACPAHLLPEALYRASGSHHTDTLIRLNLADCIECGACNAVCPSHLPLVETFIAGKAQQARKDQEHRMASLAQSRYEAKTIRLERQRTEREEAHLQKKSALQKGGSPRILEAIERARRRQQGATPEERSD